MTIKTVRSALLGSGAAIAIMAAGVPAGADEIDELREQIQRLQSKMGQLERAQIRKRRVAPAAAVEAGSKPRSWKLPGTNTSMQIGGYAKLDLIYDINGAAPGSDSILIPPRDGSAVANQQGNFRLHARQSRLWIRTWTPTDWGELQTHLQGDFFGGGGTQTASNSNAFRLRQAYGSLGPVLAGQTWTTFMILSGLPNVLDFSGPTGIVFVRQAQIRYTHSFGSGWSLQLAVENPDTSVVATTTTAPTASGSPNDPIPDFVVRLNKRGSWGSASIAGLFRQVTVDDGVSSSASTFAWCLSAGGGFRFNRGRTAIGGVVTGGQGCGRYMIASSGTPDAILNGTNPSNADLDTITYIGGTIWLQHRWTDTIRSNVVYGRMYSDLAGAASGGKGAIGAAAPGQTQDYTTVHANLIWRPVPPVDIGIEYIYQFAGIINGANGRNHRIQLSFQYRF